MPVNLCTLQLLAVPHSSLLGTVFAHVCICVHVCACSHVCVYMCACMQVCMPVLVHVCSPSALSLLGTVCVALQSPLCLVQCVQTLAASLLDMVDVPPILLFWLRPVLAFLAHSAWTSLVWQSLVGLWLSS